MPKKSNKVITPSAKFVSNFLTVMHRFPASKDGKMTHVEAKIVKCFFVRVSKFADKTLLFVDHQQLLTAFLIVNFPEEYNMTSPSNPFCKSLLYRSISFVGAAFQVVIDCSSSEDDSKEGFLPASTADNFKYRKQQFLEALKMHQEFTAKTLPRSVKKTFIIITVFYNCINFARTSTVRQPDERLLRCSGL